jgi:hypothetical protein
VRAEIFKYTCSIEKSRRFWLRFLAKQTPGFSGADMLMFVIKLHWLYD